MPKRTGRTLHFAAGGFGNAPGLSSTTTLGLAGRPRPRQRIALISASGGRIFCTLRLISAAMPMPSRPWSLTAKRQPGPCAPLPLRARWSVRCPGVEVMAAHDQQVFQAPGDVHLAVADKAQVTGAQPGAAGVLDEGLGAGFGVAPVAVGDARARGPEFADALVGQLGEGVRSAISTAWSGWLVPQLMIAGPCPGSARLAASACSSTRRAGMPRPRLPPATNRVASARP